MTHHHIEIDLQFNCTAEVLFAQLTDHVTFGQIVNAKIQRVVDSQTAEPNGLGAVRRITMIPGVSFEETVMNFQAPVLMEYQITRGSPIKEHWGRLEFKPNQTGCQLFYTIDFKAKIPGTGGLLKRLIERPIRQGLERLQESLAAEA